MAFGIVECCINCCACEAMCPTGAIYIHKTSVKSMIDAIPCTECVGDSANAQCAGICPVEGAIVDGLGVPVNPPGSLTGISHKLSL